MSKKDLIDKHSRAYDWDEQSKVNEDVMEKKVETAEDDERDDK
jgi:hypothetical protein